MVNELVFFHHSDLTFWWFSGVVVLNTLYFLSVTVVDRFCVSLVSEYLGVESVRFKQHRFVYFNQLSFLICIVFTQTFAFAFLFWWCGGWFVIPLGGSLFLSIGTSVSVVFLNLLLIGFAFVLKKRTGGVGMLEETVLCSVLHSISFLFFSVTDLVGFFISLEIASFMFFIFAGLHNLSPAEATQVKYSSVNRYAEAALRYLIPGLFSTILFLVGVFFFYLSTGTFSVAESLVVLLYQNLWRLDLSVYFCFGGLFLILVSFLFKFGVAPFHSWVFWVYSGVTSTTVLFLSTVSKLFYLLGFMRTIYPLFLGLGFFAELLCGVGLLSVLVGTLYGLYERRFLVVIASSSLINGGYTILAFALMSFVGGGLAIFSYIIYSYLLVGLFYLLTGVSRFTNNLTGVALVDDFKFLQTVGRSSWLPSVLILSLVGIPPLVGFFPKFFLLTHLVLSFSRGIGVGLLLGVIVSSFFYIRWVISMQVGGGVASRVGRIAVRSTDAGFFLRWFFSGLVIVGGWAPFLDTITSLTVLINF